MSRRQRQLDEMAALCRAGAVGRAIDLAFEHLTQFGPDGALIRLLGDAARKPDVPERIRRRFAELYDQTV